MQATLKRGVGWLVLAWALSASARAGVFELEAQVHTGGMVGSGFAGELKEQSFQNYASGDTYGFCWGSSCCSSTPGSSTTSTSTAA